MNYTLIYDDLEGDLVALAISSQYTPEDIQCLIRDIRDENIYTNVTDIIKALPYGINIIYAKGNIDSVFV